MAVVISCVNLKGGVGKTTLAVNMAAYFGRRGKRTLLIDLDPQTNATFSCIDIEKWKSHAAARGTVADLLGARKHTSAQPLTKSAQDVTVRSVFSNVDLIPSHLDLFTIDLDMAGATARETRLKKALQAVDKNYDLIICDCPPNLTIPTQNALAASSHFVVPISADFLSSLGVGILLSRIKELGQDLDQELTLAGIVISRVGRPEFHRDEIVNTLRSQFPNDVLTNSLSERVKVAEAAAKNSPIFDMNDVIAAAEFERVCTDLASRIGV